MKKFIQGMYQKKNFGVRLTAVILSVIVMGCALSLLVLVDLGTDPCTSMNLAISENWNGNRKLAGTAQYDHICLCHFAWQGKYRIWNTCQYVFSWIFTAVFFLGMG